jgi:hypothetical protein
MKLNGCSVTEYKKMKTIKVNRKDIPNSNTPLFDYCRQLLEEGEDPETRLEVYRNPDYWDVALNIGEAAKLTVKEIPGVYFAKYNPMTEKDKARLRLKGALKLSGSVTGSLK